MMYPGGLNASTMGADKLVRLDYLKEACRRLGLTKDDGTPSPSRLGAKIDRETNYCSDLLLGRRSFGEDIARHIEEKLGLGRWALDGGAGWPFPGLDRSRFDALTQEQRIEIQGVVRQRIENFEASTVVRGKPALVVAQPPADERPIAGVRPVDAEIRAARKGANKRGHHKNR